MPTTWYSLKTPEMPVNLRHADTAERIVADKKMIKELDAIPNHTLKERMERAVVKPILKTKVNFGV